MRERLALLLCLVTLVLVVGLAAWFADRHNPPASVPGGGAPAPVATGEPARTTGRAAEIPGARLFREQGCTSCHAFGGAGNPRYPLDGVGTRRTPAELRAWITGTGGAEERLAGSVVRRKQRYLELSPAELTALVDYLGPPGAAVR